MTMSKRCILAIAISVSIALLACGGDDEQAAETPVVKNAARAEKAPAAKNTAKSAAAARKSRAITPGDAKSRTRNSRAPRIQELTGLPENFPDDVPVYPKSTPEASLLSVGDDLVVSFSADGSATDVLHYYEDGLEDNGWSVESSAALDFQSLLVMTKGQRTATVLVLEAPTGTQITVTIAAE